MYDRILNHLGGFLNRYDFRNSYIEPEDSSISELFIEHAEKIITFKEETGTRTVIAVPSYKNASDYLKLKEVLIGIAGVKVDIVIPEDNGVVEMPRISKHGTDNKIYLTSHRLINTGWSCRSDAVGLICLRKVSGLVEQQLSHRLCGRGSVFINGEYKVKNGKVV